MTIDLRLVRQAQALALHGSFSRAASALGIAQPTLSRNIKELEDTIGLTLFLRLRQGVEPTDVGYLFLSQAELVVAQLGDLEREMARARGVHRTDLAVGFGPHAAELLVPGCLRRFAETQSAMSLRIALDSPEELARKLHSRRIDLIVGDWTVLEHDDQIEVVERLAPIAGHFVVRDGHPLAAKRDVELREILAYPFVQVLRLPPRVLRPMLSARPACKSGGRRAPAFPLFECPTIPLALRIVAESDAFTLTTLGAARTELELGRIVPVFHEPWLSSEWAVLQLRKRPVSPEAAGFIAELKRIHQAALTEDVRLQRRWKRAAEARPRAQASTR